MSVGKGVERQEQGELTPEERQQNDELRRRKASQPPEIESAFNGLSDPYPDDFYDREDDDSSWGSVR